jgi:hypothetical protein
MNPLLIVTIVLAGSILAWSIAFAARLSRRASSNPERAELRRLGYKEQARLMHVAQSEAEITDVRDRDRAEALARATLSGRSENSAWFVPSISIGVLLTSISMRAWFPAALAIAGIVASPFLFRFVRLRRERILHTAQLNGWNLRSKADASTELD